MWKSILALLDGIFEFCTKNWSKKSLTTILPSIYLYSYHRTRRCHFTGTYTCMLYMYAYDLTDDTYKWRKIRRRKWCFDDKQVNIVCLSSLYCRSSLRSVLSVDFKYGNQRLWNWLLPSFCWQILGCHGLRVRWIEPHGHFSVHASRRHGKWSNFFQT